MKKFKELVNVIYSKINKKITTYLSYNLVPFLNFLSKLKKNKIADTERGEASARFQFYREGLNRINFFFFNSFGIIISFFFVKFP